MTQASTIYANGTDPSGEQVTRSDVVRPPTAPGSTPGGPRKNDRFAGAGAGYTMVAAALLGVGIGYVIDAMSGTKPLWTIVCFFAFLLAGTWQLIKETQK